MRKYLFIILSFLGASSSYGQKFYRYIDNKKDPLTFSDSKFFLFLGDTSNLRTIQEHSFVRKLDKVDSKGTYMIETTQNLDYSTILQIWKNDSNISYISPVILSKGKEMAGYTSKIIAKTKEELKLDELQKIFSKYDLEISGFSNFDKKVVYLGSKEKDALENQNIANVLFESGTFQYVEPNYLLIVYPSSDPKYIHQWHLNNTGQIGGSTGEDIKAEGAWDIETGSSSVRIAIMDSGVDLDHEDLIDNLDPGYDATGGSSGGEDFDGHGTVVAGIAAAKGNNSKGVRGLAYNSKLVPIKFYSTYSWTTTESSYLKSAIEWVRLGNKAEIVNMSFVIYETTLLNDEINLSASSGRGGKGIIFVAAASNENNNWMEYPASKWNVIAVGASNQFGQRVSPTSSDGLAGGLFVGSNYGSGLDLVSPGVAIRSTFIGGGYSDVTGFNGARGTSFSTPQVSATAALVLSINPNLTRSEVQEILESTADKIGSYTYTLAAGEKPNLTWNNEVGYGRLNACKAVMLAKAGKINGADIVCWSTTYTIDAVPSGASVSWSSSNPSLLSIDPSTGNANKLGSRGSVTITATVSKGCGNIQLKKTVWVGTPDLEMTFNTINVVPSSTVYVSADSYNYLDLITNSPLGGLTYNTVNFAGSGDIGLTITSQTTASPEIYVHNSSSYGYRTLQSSISNYCGSTYEEFNLEMFSFFKSAYPNPAVDYLTIEFNSINDLSRLPDAIDFINEKSIKKELSLSIEDIRKDSKNLNGNKYRIDISNLERGIWYLHARKKNHKTEVIRLLLK